VAPNDDDDDDDDDDDERGLDDSMGMKKGDGVVKG
jgi:hypothetical protein